MRKNAGVRALFFDCANADGETTALHFAGTHNATYLDKVGVLMVDCEK